MGCSSPPYTGRIGRKLRAYAGPVLGQVAGLTRVKRPQQEKFVASSYQFLLLDWSGDAIRDMVAGCLACGVELKWFGAVEPVGFTSRYDSWTYAPSSPMSSTDRVCMALSICLYR